MCTALTAVRACVSSRPSYLTTILNVPPLLTCGLAPLVLTYGPGRLFYEHLVYEYPRVAARAEVPCGYLAEIIRPYPHVP